MKLFDNALMTVNLLGLLRVWGQLVEAYHGVNGYGGDTAEIYAYHLTRYSPNAHVGVVVDKPTEPKRLVAMQAANALCSIVEEFCNEYADCRAEIDGISLAEWCALNNHGRHVYDHRCHVRIVRTQP